MGSMSIVHWMIVIGVVVLLFGRHKISDLMGDVAQGIKSFKKGMRDDEPGGPEAAEGKQPRIDEHRRLSSPVGQPAHRSDSPA